MMNAFGYGDHSKYHLYRKETDMRKGFDSLCGIISGELGKRVLDGDVFIFISKAILMNHCIFLEIKPFSSFLL
jgi:transposase